MRVLQYGHARVAAVAAFATLVGLALSHALGRVYWNEVVFALNGWYTPYDLGVFLQAGNSVLAGHSPYPDPATFAGDDNYVYPPTLALLMTPLSALPERHAVTLYMLLSIGAILLAIRLLGVRDWRCYTLALLFPFVYETLRHGALGSFLFLLLALLWRYRDRAVVAGAALALAVALKLFLWPFVVWLALTRRFRAAAIAVAGGVGLALASWAAIGFAGFTDYLRLLELLADEEAESSFSVVAVGSVFGFPYTVGNLIALALGLGLLALAAHEASSRPRPRAERDRVSLILVLGASLALTPIVWLHYFILLLLPIAVARPRLSPLWFLPLALWPMFWLDEYRSWPDGDIDALAAAIGLAVAISTVAVRRPLHSRARRWRG